jgi:hypothetical protein
MLVGGSGKGTGGNGMAQVNIRGTTLMSDARMVGKSSHGWQYSQLMLDLPTSDRLVDRVWASGPHAEEPCSLPNMGIVEHPGERPGIRALIDGLDATSTDLLRSLVWSPSGTFTEFDFNTEPVVYGIRALTDAMLVTPATKAQPYVRIPPEVKLMVALPGVSLRDVGPGITSDYIANVLRENGVKPIPTRRDERIETLLQNVRLLCRPVPKPNDAT